MNYYFPSILSSLKFSSGELPHSFHTVNSGENAVRLLLRSFGLQQKAKILLPLYVCDSLKEAVLKEGFEPVYADLKSDGSFWSDYNAVLSLNEKPAVVILVHLYGFLHPDANAVMEFCKNHSIFLIHDSAQSYGIDEKALVYSSGLVYSFGPGKSSTAASGAIVKGLTEEFYKQNCKSVSNFSIQTFRAQLFLTSRIYGYKFSAADKLLQRLISLFETNDTISTMTKFQQEAAATALQLVNGKSDGRRERYKLLEEAVKANALLGIPYNDGKGLYFKLVLSAGTNTAKFKTYLTEHNVPFFSLRDKLEIGMENQDQYSQFSKYAESFIELSTESSLPLEVIQRVADVLKRFA
jgi:dTDP-4-amino-4,6-dideoxygalactose transaminase